MMRPASARGSEAASVEDAAHPTGRGPASCLRVDPLAPRGPLWREVNKSPTYCMLAGGNVLQNKYPHHRQHIWSICSTQSYSGNRQHIVIF